MTNVYLLQYRLLAGKVLSADWIMLRLVIDRVHSRAIGLQFVSVGKFSIALGNLFQLEKRLFRDHCKCIFYRSQSFIVPRSFRCKTLLVFIFVMKNERCDFILTAF